MPACAYADSFSLIEGQTNHSTTFAPVVSSYIVLWSPSCRLPIETIQALRPICRAIALGFETVFGVPIAAAP